MKKKQVRPHGPDQAERGETSRVRFEAEVIRINRALELGRRMVPLLTRSEALSEKLVAAYGAAGWRVQQGWLRQRRFLTLTKPREK